MVSAITNGTGPRSLNYKKIEMRPETSFVFFRFTVISVCEYQYSYLENGNIGVDRVGRQSRDDYTRVFPLLSLASNLSNLILYTDLNNSEPINPYHKNKIKTFYASERVRQY